MRKIGHNKLNLIMIVVLIISLGSVLLLERYGTGQGDRFASTLGVPDQERTKTSIDAAISVVTDIDFPTQEAETSENVVVSFQDIAQGYRKVDVYTGIYEFDEPLTSDDTYQLIFKMRAEDTAAKVGVSFGSAYTYYLTTQWKEYAIICSGREIRTITWQLQAGRQAGRQAGIQPIYLSDVRVIAYGQDTDLSKLRNGTYSVEPLPEVMFPEEGGLGIGETWDVAGDGEYLYSIGNGKLTITKPEWHGAAIVSTLDGLGSVRHLALRDDGLLAVASRESGVYLINVQDKANPALMSYYDPLGIANDVCFADHYMFVASRYFGIEIVDIANPRAPVYIGRIVNEKECFRCMVQDQYLFVSCWASQDVEIYDISEVNAPALISTVNVDGRCGESFVCDSILYIVSGYTDAKNAKKIGDNGYGTGHGVALYDISDIKRPQWCSTIKAEGSLQSIGYDDWSVQASNGYVYFTNSFGGVYIYDVGDVYAPISVGWLYVPVFADSTRFSKQPDDTVFPYDEREFIISPATGIYVGNGSVYFACAYNDVYRYEFSDAVRAKIPSSDVELSEGQIPQKNFQDATYSLETFDIYAIAAYSEGRYVAGSAVGVLLLDQEMNVINQYLTAYPVKDVAVTSEGYIVTAETRGIGTYAVTGQAIMQYGYVKSEAKNCNVSAIAVTGDEKYAIVQSSWTSYEAVDLHNVSNPYLVEYVVTEEGEEKKIGKVVRTGNMYYHNIISGDISGIVGIAGRERAAWFESLGDQLSIRHTSINGLHGESNGSVVLEDMNLVLTVYKNGYVVYDPFGISELNGDEMDLYKLKDVRLQGKVSANGHILSINNESAGIIYILDISEVSRPKLRAVYYTENSPGIALIEKERILIPMRHGGIMGITY